MFSKVHFRAYCSTHITYSHTITNKIQHIKCMILLTCRNMSNLSHCYGWSVRHSFHCQSLLRDLTTEDHTLGQRQEVLWICPARTKKKSSLILCILQQIILWCMFTAHSIASVVLGQHFIILILSCVNLIMSKSTEQYLRITFCENITKMETETYQLMQKSIWRCTNKPGILEPVQNYISIAQVCDSVRSYRRLIICEIAEDFGMRHV
jgi:hypothetical protein